MPREDHNYLRRHRDEHRARSIVEAGGAEIKIRIDQAQKPSYPEGANLVFPALESSGPSEYDLSKVKLWKHKKQTVGQIKARVLFEELKESENMEEFLGLSDLAAIQSQGIEVFNKLYRGKNLIGWRSLVEDQEGNLFVPIIQERKGQVVLNWHNLIHRLDSSSFSLRFDKESLSQKVV